MTFSNFKEEFFKLIKETLQDSATGKYSTAKVILLLTTISAVCFIWKLIILGNLTVDIFLAFLAYGSGHSNISKFLDSKFGKKEDPKEPPK